MSPRIRAVRAIAIALLSFSLRLIRAVVFMGSVIGFLSKILQSFRRIIYTLNHPIVEYPRDELVKFIPVTNGQLLTVNLHCLTMINVPLACKSNENTPRLINPEIGICA